VLLRPNPPLHLTYCTNIHPTEGWDATNAALRRITPALKRRLSPDAPFGIGLRLSARDARELLEGANLRDLRAFLDAEGMYVAIINGFPYGPFSGEPVKTNVYAPDWRTDARVDYTCDLATILSALLPDAVAGGISTVPLSYKAWMRNDDAESWSLLTKNVLRVADRLRRIHQDTGKFIHLDIEPEPDCLLETSEETVEFFERWLHPAATPDLRAHVQVCFDCCHCAVEYEDPSTAIERLQAAGISIGRVQLSSALKVARPREEHASRLEQFADATYLHQVVERCSSDFRRFSDLDVALASSGRAGCDEWRIHFHVPLFAADYEGLSSSQDVVRDVLAKAKREAFTQHLEIETYTWNVLPAGLKMDIGDSIAREYEWVLRELRS
jgi:sugar phosphate isomerase/epimerase